ncbi:MAG: hypothetical protein HGA76_01225 [Candidatus Firestonebacteria bacterium]|nr:hypothetical protein [Candidatus Firestonebacteria bacterium]
MDKRKTVLAVWSVLLLVGVMAGTYAWVFHGGQSRSAAVCAPSTVAGLAVKHVKDPESRKKILALDQAFSGQYAQVCTELCAERTRLARRLGEAPSDDPESQRLMNRITADQAQLEILTWQHIMRVRDSLPEPARTSFVQAVQAQWGEAVSRMQHHADTTGACTLHGPGSMGTGEKK